MSIFRNSLLLNKERLYLIKDGIINESVVGNMTYYKTAGAATEGGVNYGTEQQNYTSLYAAQWSAYQWYSDKIIPFSSYKRLCVDASYYKLGAYAHVYWRKRNIDIDEGNNVADIIPLKDSGNRVVISYDIPNDISKSQLIFNFQNIGVGSDSMIYIYNMWLEDDSLSQDKTLLLYHFDKSYTDYGKDHMVPEYKRNNTSSYYPGKFGYAVQANSISNTYMKNNLWDLILDSFTIEMWIYPLSFSSSNANNGRPLLGMYNTSTWECGWLIALTSLNESPSCWQFWFTDGNPSHEERLFSNTELELNQWQHLAVTYDKSSSKLTLFYNGVVDSETTLSFTPSREFINDFSFTFGGWYPPNWSGYPNNAYIDEVRISKEVKYYGNFTPQNKPFD